MLVVRESGTAASLETYRPIEVTPTSESQQERIELMSLYYSERGIEIHLGDAREILPQLGRFDLLLTDPPYGLGISGVKGSDRPNGWKLRNGYKSLSDWDSIPISTDLLKLTMDVAFEHCIWGGNYFLPALEIHRGWLVWDKAQYDLTMSDGELAYTSRDGVLRIFNLHRTHLWQEQPQHPTQKPLALMKWCLSLFPDAKSVLDPFLGSGTTLVAAKAMGLTGVGIEMHEKYCEISARRLEQEVLDFGYEKQRAGICGGLLAEVEGEEQASEVQGLLDLPL